MKQKIYKLSKTNGHAIFSQGCIIVATIFIFSVLFGACSHPRSVRPGNIFQSKNNIVKEKVKTVNEPIQVEQKIEPTVKSNNTAIEDEIQLEQTQIASLPEETIADKPIVKRLPSLREQLNNITEDQQTIIKDVNILQNDVSNIKSTIEDIKTEILKLNGKKSDNAIKGNIDENKTEIYDIDKLNNLEGTILSDEETSSIQHQENNSIQQKPKNTSVKKKQTVKKPYTINKTIKNIENKKKDAIDKPTTIAPVADKPIKASKAEPINFIAAKNTFIHKDFNSAIDQLSKIVQTEKNPGIVSDCQFYLGESHFGLHQYDRAIDFYGKVVNSTSSSKRDEAQIKIAESNIRLGKSDNAKKAYAQFVQMFPKSDLMPKARKMLQQL